MHMGNISTTHADGVGLMKRSLFVALSLVGMFLAQSAFADVTISAAISLKGALERAQPELEKIAGEKITFNFGASGTLVGQIQQGAPVDLFISADRPTADRLVAAGAGDKATLAVITGNALVLVLPKDKAASPASPKAFADLPKAGKIAIGDPKAVPAGAYAREVLTQLKLWDELEKGGKLVTAENVAQVLALTQRGEVDAGIVYATDVRAAADKVALIATAGPAMHSTIEYVSVIVTATRRRDAAIKVQQHLLSPAVQTAFREFGFTAPPAPRPASAPAAAVPAK
jgi:molybdate transport system substrate-binding protein